MSVLLLGLAILAAYSVILVVLLAFCRVAGRADEELERLHCAKAPEEPTYEPTREALAERLPGGER